jgi:hypothetical protein
MVVDGHTAARRALIMDFNAQPSYLVPTTGLLGTRGFTITTVDQSDVRKIQRVKRGADVRIITNADPPAMAWENVQALSDSGVLFTLNPTYSDGPLFIHSKGMNKDAGAREAMAFVGSQNPGHAVSLNSERELGLIVDCATITNRLHATLEPDWAVWTPLEFIDGQPKNPYR